MRLNTYLERVPLRNQSQRNDLIQYQQRNRSIQDGIPNLHVANVDGINTELIQYPDKLIDWQSEIQEHQDFSFSDSIATENAGTDYLTVVIPGNPGVSSFYNMFLEDLSEKISSQIHSKDRYLGGVVVGHAGHNLYTNINNRTSPFSVDEQVYHKSEFLLQLQKRIIEQHESTASRLQLIIMGHSVGAYIILKMLRECPYINNEEINSPNNIHLAHCLFLFPTIQFIPNLTSISLLSTPVIRHTLGALVHLMGCLVPKAVFKWLAGKIAFRAPVADEFRPLAALLAHFGFVNNALFMARTEFSQIKELDDLTFTKWMNKIDLYFGEEDAWVPSWQPKKMKERFPNANIHLDEDGTAHAFVLTHSSFMADRVIEILKNRIDIK